MLDFNKFLNKNEVALPTNPEDIYNTLDRTTAAGPLRDVQRNVLNEWYTNHVDDKDVIVKLHTGEGKTLVGLLILLSRMYSEKGPCLYVCPNKQLMNQAAADAAKFGIPYVLFGEDNYLPGDFLENKKILITTVQKVFNGKTVFKLDNQSLKIGSFVLDDSHACIESIKSSLSIRIPKTHQLYTAITTMFESDLRKLGEGTYYEIINNTFSSGILPIPYWAWVEKSQDVLRLLMEYSEERFLLFTLPLLRDVLHYSTAFVSSREIEIAPYCSLIERFGSFFNAGQRVLMSATTQDDAFFIRGLGLSKETVLHPLTDSSSKWSGEKMIIFPSLIDDRLGNDSMRRITAHLSKLGYNVAVLVPGYYTADIHKAEGCNLLKNSAEVEEVINKLRGKTPMSVPQVFVNRYDGIDLADDMCRILVIDSLPNNCSLPEYYEVTCREGSDIVNVKTAQRIEQGLGRSVRSVKDYSVIIVIGADIVRFMKNPKTQHFFSAQTIQQIKIGADVAEQLKKEQDAETPFKPVQELIGQCLRRDPAWKNYYTSTMDELVPVAQDHPLIEFLEKEREADKALLRNELQKVCDIYRSLADEHKGKGLDYGWYLQELAKYTYFTDKANFHNVQQRAFSNNRYVLIPDTVTYKKVQIVDDNRSRNIQKWLKHFGDYSSLRLFTNEMMANFSFGVSAKKFEQAVMDIGAMLGFASQRPDEEIKKGPDNLWGMKQNCYMAIECKDEVQLSRTFISKEEVGQMNNHCGWFECEYGENVDVTYFMIHPTNVVSEKANFTHNVLVMTPEQLNALKTKLHAFITGLAKYDIGSIDADTITALINANKLDIDSLKRRYSVPAKKIIAKHS